VDINRFPYHRRQSASPHGRRSAPPCRAARPARDAGHWPGRAPSILVCRQQYRWTWRA